MLFSLFSPTLPTIFTSYIVKSNPDCATFLFYQYKSLLWWLWSFTSDNPPWHFIYCFDVTRTPFLTIWEWAKWTWLCFVMECKSIDMITDIIVTNRRSNNLFILTTFSTYDELVWKVNVYSSELTSEF